MRKKLAFLFLIIVFISGMYYFVFRKSVSGKKDKAGSNSETVEVKRGDILVSINVTGTIKPLKVVEVKSKASGKIIRMPVEQGDYLEKGKLIVEIEKTFTQPEVDKAKAALDAAQARLEKIKTEIELEKETNQRLIKNAENNSKIAELKLTQMEIGSRPEEIKRAEASLSKAKSNLELARSQYDRMVDLSGKGFTSKDELDSLKTQLESAKAEYELAVQNLELIKNPATKEDLAMERLQVNRVDIELQAARENVKTEKAREKDIISANAEVVKAEVALKLAEDNLKDTLITAPISGTILEKGVEEGQIISSGMSQTSTGTTIATMANLAKVYINANIDETDIGSIIVGQTVKITVDAFPKKVFKGQVLRIAPKGEVVQNVTTFEVTVEIKNPSIILKPGMNASLDVIIVDKREVLYVANDALNIEGKNIFVYIINNGKTEKREIETGASTWENTEIVSGLNEGEIIKIEKLKPGKENKNGRTNNPIASFGRTQARSSGR